MTPHEAAAIALDVADAAWFAAADALRHRIAWGSITGERGRAEHAQAALTARGLWDAADPFAAAAGAPVAPASAAERALMLGLTAAEAYVVAREAELIAVILAHDPSPRLAQRRDQLAARLPPLRASLAAAAAELAARVDATSSPAVAEAIAWLVGAIARDARAIHEGLRRVCAALDFPPEATPGPITAAEAELVRAILARPDDDELRRRWVDVAAARGEPRAELARAQLATRAARRRAPGSPVLDPPLVASLIARHPAWLADVRRLGATAAELHRGFVEAIEVDAATFAARADALFATAPILHVRLRGGAAAHLAALLAAGALDRMISIDLAGQGLDDDDAAQLAARPLPALRALELADNRLSAAGARALCAARPLAYLGLDRNPCGPLAVSGWSAAEHPTPTVELTELGAALERELGPRPCLYARARPPIDLL